MKRTQRSASALDIAYVIKKPNPFSKRLQCALRNNCLSNYTHAQTVCTRPSFPLPSKAWVRGYNQQQHIERTNPRNPWKTPLSTLWPTSVSRSWPSSFWTSRRADQQLLLVCNIMLCQHLGVPPEEGAYSQDKMSDPTYKPPVRFQLALRLQNGGRICSCGDSGYVSLSNQICSFDYTVVTLFADSWRHTDQFMLQKSSREEAGQCEYISCTNHPERKLANVSSCKNQPERKLANESSCINHPERKLANMGSCTNHPNWEEANHPNWEEAGQREWLCKSSKLRGSKSSKLRGSWPT